MTRAAAVGGAPDDSAAATPPQAGTLDARLVSDLLALLAEDGDSDSRDGGLGDSDSRDGGVGDGHSRDGGVGDGHSRDGGVGDGHSRDGGVGDGHSRDGGVGDGHSRDGGVGDGDRRDGGVGDGDRRDGGVGDGVGGGRTIVRSPLTREELARVPHTTARGVAAAFARARAAQRRWARLPARTRSRVLLRFHDLLVTRQDTVMEVVTAETGKARRHAFDEVLHLALTARYYARTGARQVRSRGARGAIPGLTRVRVHQIPKGVVGVISPWNYPFTLASCDGLAAVMAGNAVVLKPDERTMLSALIGKRLLVEAGMPEDLWQIVAGPGPSVGQELISHADHVCFTGSVATGRVVARQCAERLIGCSLELGGKNAFVVLRDADLDKAAEGAVRAAFPNAGQLCVSSERFYVDRAVLDAFVDRFVARTRAMVFTGDGSWENAMGSLISRDQLDKVATHVEDAVVKGATVLTGGAPRPEHGPYFFEPTILAGVTADMECHLQETFGPVVAVHPFDDERAVLGQVNAGDMGLNASVFGGRRARAFARGVVAGTVNINEGYAASFASIDSPMGGMRQSGLGRRQGREGILRFTEPQAVARQYVTRFGPADGMSVERYARLMTLSLRVLRRLRRA